MNKSEAINKVVDVLVAEMIPEVEKAHRVRTSKNHYAKYMGVFVKWDEMLADMPLKMSRDVRLEVIGRMMIKAGANEQGVIDARGLV